MLIRRRFLPSSMAVSVLPKFSFEVSGTAQQRPEIGIAPVTSGDKPYVFDKAAQHKVHVTVVARVLSSLFVSGRAHMSGDAVVEFGNSLEAGHATQSQCRADLSLRCGESAFAACTAPTCIKTRIDSQAISYSTLACMRGTPRNARAFS